MKKYDARISIDFLPSSNQYCDAFSLSLIVKRPLYVMLSSVIISITALKISKIKVSPIIKSHLEFLQAKTLPYTRWGMLVLKMIGVKSTLSSLKKLLEVALESKAECENFLSSSRYFGQHPAFILIQFLWLAKNKLFHFDLWFEFKLVDQLLRASVRTRRVWDK